jgi:hypothetical protein
MYYYIAGSSVGSRYDLRVLAFGEKKSGQPFLPQHIALGKGTKTEMNFHKKKHFNDFLVSPIPQG